MSKTAKNYRNTEKHGSEVVKRGRLKICSFGFAGSSPAHVIIFQEERLEKEENVKKEEEVREKVRQIVSSVSVMAITVVFGTAEKGSIPLRNLDVVAEWLTRLT